MLMYFIRYTAPHNPNSIVKYTEKDSNEFYQFNDADLKT